MSLTATRFADRNSPSLAAVLAVFAAVPVFFLAAPAKSERSVEIGYVRSFEGIAETYSIFRQNELMNIQFFLPIHQGDIILLHADQGRVELSLGDNNTLVQIETEHFPCPVAPEDWEPTSETEHSPCPVPPVDRPPTIPQIAYEQLGGWLSERNDYQVITGVTMGGPGSLALRIPGLADGRTQLVAAERPFGIAWLGGTPPFDVQVVYQKNGAAVIDRSMAGGTAVETRYLLTEAPINLVEGGYRVVIRDNRGFVVEGSFSAAPSSTLPVPPVELGPSSFDAAAADTIMAAWLAGQADGLWALEALQRCLPMLDSYQPASALCRALAVGQTPTF